MPGTVTPTNPKLDAINDVIIDGNGRFKYILCKIYENNNRNDFKYIVRGTARAEYHSDIYDELDAQLEEHGLVCECLGGGKITHKSDEKGIEVGGKSQGYGPANHEISVGVLKKTFKGYNSITWTEG